MRACACVCVVCVDKKPDIQQLLSKNTFTLLVPIYTHQLRMRVYFRGGKSARYLTDWLDADLRE